MFPAPAHVPDPLVHRAALARLLDMIGGEGAPMGMLIPVWAAQSLSGSYSAGHGVGYMRRSLSGASARTVFAALQALGMQAADQRDGTRLELRGLDAKATLKAG